MYKCEICEKEIETLCDLEIHNGKSHKQIIIKEIKCELCGKKFETLKGLSSHIWQAHKNEITIEEYYLKFIGEKGKCKECGKDTRFNNLKKGYSKFCSLKCSNNSIEVQNKRKENHVKKLNYKHSSQNLEFQKEIKLNVECKICGKKFEALKGLSAHIGQIHKNEITIEEYYIKFIGEKGKCKECGKDVNFINMIHGYYKFCSLKCSNNSIEVQNKRKETCFENSGYEYPSQNPITKEKQKQTCFENSGYEYPGQNPITREKYENTNMKNMGYKYPMQNPEIKEKTKQTCFENSGYEYPTQNPETIEKIQESILNNNNGIHPCKLTYQQCQERYPDVVKIEKLIEGPNGEIMGHCKNSSCKNSEENGGYFELTVSQINNRKQGINGNDTAYLYCCEECKHSCPLYHRSASALHNLINENKEILYTAEEYSTWRNEVFQRQLRQSPEHTINYCEYCHAIEDLHVHHIHPQKLEPGYALDPDNGMVVCEKCHYEKCHEKGTDCSTGNLANKICK